MTILVLGGRGKTAIRLAALLSAAKVPFLLASRSISSSVPYKQAIFDWLDESTWSQPFNFASGEASLGPVSAVYIVAPLVVDMVPPMNRFIDFALKKGVKRLVLLSSCVLERGGPVMGGVHAYLADLAEKRADIEWAVLRPTWFMENVSELQHLKTIKDENKIYSAARDGKIPWVSAEDIAGVAFHALTDERPHNTDHVILGPELLSYGQIAEILSSILHREIRHVNLSETEFKDFMMSTYGMSEDYANLMVGWDVDVSNGAEERTNNVIEEVTGVRPLAFRDFAERVKECWE